MNVLKKLEAPSKPYNGFTKLAKGYHQIVQFKSVKNKFGKKSEYKKSIIVELEDQVLFLPGYFWQKINEDDIAALNIAISECQMMYLFFGGKQPEGK